MTVTRDDGQTQTRAKHSLLAEVVCSCSSHCNPMMTAVSRINSSNKGKNIWLVEIQRSHAVRGTTKEIKNQLCAILKEKARISQHWLRDYIDAEQRLDGRLVSNAREATKESSKVQ